ncbi:MAG: hypothetical protein U9R37_09250 [Campylobacterota bacterium]|nr:hypothetical protein [Campylobacterota bacterium]
MNKFYAILTALAIVVIASMLFQILKYYFNTLEPTGFMFFILETIKIVPLILGVLLIKYSWKKINNNLNQ